MLANSVAEFSKPDKDEESTEACPHQPESNECSLPSAPPHHKVVLFCPLPGEVHNFNWWLTMCFEDHFDIFYMYAEMGNNEWTEMQLKFQDSPNPSVIVTTPSQGGRGINLPAPNHPVITQKRRVWNMQCQVLATVV
jgi:hypothetical protein